MAVLRATDEHKQAMPRGTVTVRAVAVGVAFAVAVNAWLTYAEYIIRSSQMNLSHMPVSFIALYVVTILILIPLRFAEAELVTILSMGLVAAVIPTNGLTGFWLGVLTAPYYFATPQNRWESLVHPHLPDWIAPHDTNRAIEWFYNGLPPGESIPWDVWIVPAAWWLSLIGAVLVLSLCIAAVLRKPWVEHERLVFPIAEAGLALMRDGPSRGHLPGIFGSTLFRIGFAISFGIMAWNCAGYFIGGWPSLKLWYGTLTPIKGFPSIGLRINFLTLGLCYFADTSALLSVWLFFLLLGAEHMILSRFGYAVGASTDPWSSFDAMAAWQSFGALIALVAYGLWTARGHLGTVFRAAVSGGPENDDPRELMSFRVAVVAGSASFVYIVAWLHSGGMSILSALAWTFATLVIFIGVARIVSETGLPYMRGPLTAQAFTIHSLGAANTSASLAILTFTYAFLSQGKGFAMTQIMHGAKLASHVRSARTITTSMLVAAAVGVIVCLVLTLTLGYGRGAFNFSDYAFAVGGRHMFGILSGYIANPIPVAWDRLRFLGIGSVGMVLLFALRARFHWWTLSPIGLAIGGTYATHIGVLMVFVAWLIKVTLLRLGGLALYNRVKPLFLGLGIGYALGVAFSFIVDWVWFPGAGHIHSW